MGNAFSSSNLHRSATYALALTRHLKVETGVLLLVGLPPSFPLLCRRTLVEGTVDQRMYWCGFREGTTMNGNACLKISRPLKYHVLYYSGGYHTPKYNVEVSVGVAGAYAALVTALRLLAEETGVGRWPQYCSKLR